MQIRLNGRMMGAQSGGPLTRLLTALAGVALLITATVFSAIVLMVALAAGLVFGAWFWWQTRALRRRSPLQPAARQSSPGHAPDHVPGYVIEGELNAPADQTPAPRTSARRQT